MSFFPFFLFLLIHGTLSFFSQDFFFHIENCRHFSNPALVYNTWCSDRQMNGGSIKGFVTQACTEMWLRALFWDVRVFSSGMAFLLFVLCFAAEWLSHVVSPGRDASHGYRRQILTPVSNTVLRFLFRTQSWFFLVLPTLCLPGQPIARQIK